MIVKPVLGSVRARMTLLLVLSIIPLVLIAVALAFDAYLEALEQPRAIAAATLRGAVARHEAALDRTTATLSRLSSARPPGPASCDDLATALALEPARFAGLALLDRAGRPLCEAAEPGVALAGSNWPADVALARSVQTGGPAIGALVALPGTGFPALTLFVPIKTAGMEDRTLAAAIRLEWLAGQIGEQPDDDDLSFWLIDRAAQPHALADTRSDRLPAPETLPADARSAASSADGASLGGEPFSYATGPVRDGYALLAAYRQSRIRAHARAALVRHLGAVAITLVVGLLVMGGGIDRAVVRPLKRLTAAVQHWRGGGAFHSGSLEGMPTEVVDLSKAFSHATGALAEHEAQLQRAVTQQELLMQEIHHRVKNNLQIVASLLNLQASRIRQPEAKAEFQAARDRVRALATLHRHLYADGELRTINMRSFLMELCGQLFQAMGEREGDRIHLTVDAPELQMSSDQAVPLSLIVTEAVSNAVKYAFPNGRRGHVAVRLATDRELAHLSIEDDGVGIPPGQGESESGPRDGLGLQLIRGFARQLGATLTVSEGHGTRYEVEIPLRPDRPDGDGAAEEASAAA